VLSEDGAVGLYEAIDSLPEGARLEYKSADGTIVVYEPYVQGPGRIDVIVRTQSTDAAGRYHDSSHKYEGIEREWCLRQEGELRDIGIDPNVYTVI
jgi:hypothetical protein